MGKAKDKKSASASDFERPSDEKGPTDIVLQSSSPNLTRLPGAVQRALAQYQVKEKSGFAPLWVHETEGDYIIGTIVNSRQTGQFESWIITIDAKVTGNENSQLWQAENRFLAVWLTQDLETKLNAEEEGLNGRHVMIRFDGWLRKTDNPRLKNDMKLYTVSEFSAKQLTE